MRCPPCGHDNPRGARFCSACGTALTLRCLRCQAELPANAKFCLECGTPTAPADAEHAPRAPRAEALLPPSAATATPEGERRQLTVLFCDLVGSTPLSQQLDAEDWRDVVTQYHHAATGAVTRFGGHVAHYMGDGLLVYFGWPTAREDDPERAARAGLAILDAMAPSTPHSPPAIVCAWQCAWAYTRDRW